MPRVSPQSQTPLPQTMPTLPEREGEFKRLLNALNGGELRQLILSRLTETLANDRRFANHLTFPLAAVSIRLDVMVQPREPEQAHFFLEKSMAWAEVAKDDDGEPLDGQTIALGHDWPPAVLINVREFLGLDRAPDEIREANGLAVPNVRRQQGSPTAYEETADRSPRAVTIGAPDGEDLSDLPEAFQRKYLSMKASDPQTAKRLLDAVRTVGYKQHPSSPLVDAPRIIQPGQGEPEAPQVMRTEPITPRRPGQNAAKTAKVPQGNLTPSPGAQLEAVITEQNQLAKAALPPRTVEIKSGGDMEARAMRQKDAGAPAANRQVKFSLDEAPQGAPGLDNFVPAGDLKE